MKREGRESGKGKEKGRQGDGGKGKKGEGKRGEESWYPPLFG